MKTYRLALLLLMLWGSATAFAQGSISGKVIDKASNDGIGYASVSIHKVTDSALVNGVITSDNGNFVIEKLPNGRYLLRVTFMGFQTYWSPTPISISDSKKAINVGRITIAPTATTMQAVEVTAERSMVDYQLDKRVINVDKNIVAGGGTATDVLEQVPSVTVDNDGNVSLRGSSNVKILIDGRPSELLSNDLSALLDQIPASSVENVEVITNPSAKYDPEGMSGIINIKLKDRASNALGWNGLANINIGSPMPFSIPDEIGLFMPTATSSISMNYTTEKYNFTFSADGGRRTRGRTTETYIRRYGTNPSEDSLYMMGCSPSYMGSIKVGFEYFFNKKNSAMISYQLRGGNRVRGHYIEDHDLLYGGLMNYIEGDTSENRDLNHSINFNFTHKFDKADQLLTLDATYSRRHGWGEGSQEQYYPYTPSNLQHYFLRESESDNYNNNFNVKLNYTHPFAEKWKFETGYEGRITSSDQDYEYYLTQYDALSVLNKERDSLSSMNYLFQQQIHAVYATLGGKITDKLSAQAGLRGEYSHVYGVDHEHPQSEEVNKPYWQLYPTIHISYEINKNQSFQLSYSRRVRRPWMWDLNPYINVREGSQMSFGNPSLDPEFTNAYELSYNLGFKQTNIYTSLYYRQTNNQMTWFGFVWDSLSVPYYAPWMSYNPDYDNYWASTAQNLGSSVNAGLELIIDQQVTKWWKVNASVNLFNSSITGNSTIGDSTRSAFHTNAKLSSFMSLPNDWTIQLSAQYNSPWFDLQTDMDASYWADLAIKKDLWNKRATLNFRISDVFATGAWGHTTINSQMYRVMKSKRISPNFTIGFSYKINKGLRQQPQMDYEDEGSSLSY